MNVDVLIGLQWGDEGKGKIVDYLAPKYDLVARFQGGANAGHTLYIDGRKIVLHTIPSGIFHDGVDNLIGNGVVVDPVTLRRELDEITALGTEVSDRLYLSKKAHLILPTHKLLDAASERAKGKAKIGSTLKGIGPAYMDKTGRNGLRVGDVGLPDFDARYRQLKRKHQDLLRLYDGDWSLDETVEREWLEALDFLYRSVNIVDGEWLINHALRAGRRVLAEGAQGSMLDVEFGTYPYVTSSNTLASGACTGLGIAPSRIGEVIGITKAYCTRVGGGPFPTELHGETGEKLRKLGSEFGATTGRPRRCGWIDLPALRYTIMLNGVTQLVITKADILNHFDELQVCTAYEIDGETVDELPYDLAASAPDSTVIKPVYQTLPGWQQDLGGYDRLGQLPPALSDYLAFLEAELDVPVRYLSVGPKREELLIADAVADA